MTCFFQNSSFCLLMITIACFILFSPVSSEETVDQNLEGELEIDPFSVREEGCPIIIERNGLDLNRLNGSWKMPYSSLNWIADIGMALYNHSVKMSHIMTICPTIQIRRRASTKEDNSTWILVWKCPKLHGEFELRCWRQHANTSSKYVCWNNREDRDVYLMVGATDHERFLVLVRCSPGEPGRPSEGMSWAILTRSVPFDSQSTEVLMGLLEGYGFDVEEFQTQLFYDDCTP